MDFQSFLQTYEAQHPDEVVHIERRISHRFEPNAIIAELERRKRFPILIFHHVDIDGYRSELPLVTFVMASRKRLAMLMNTSVENAGIELYERMKRRIPPVVVSRNEAPVKQVVKTGPDIDLTKLPAPIHHEMDPGAYITAGFLTCYNPETGIENSAIQRGWIKDRDEVRVYPVTTTDNGVIYSKHQKLKRDMRAAYWIGHHPLVVLGCELHVGINDSHYATAGGVSGEPLRLVPSETLGDDFLIPADAEFVIEGIIPHDELRPEGPFGEFTRYSGPQRLNPFMRVTAVTHRRQPLWQDVMVGHTHWLSSLTTEGKVAHTVAAVVPTLRGVYLPMSGTGAYHVYLQIEKRTEGLGKLALMSALTADHRLKHAFVFDEDVDIFNESDVLLALATRFQGDKDLIVVPDSVGSPLDPIAPGDALTGTKVGFDCTKPAPPEPFSRRLDIPKEVKERVRLEDFIPKAALERVTVEPYG